MASKTAQLVAELKQRAQSRGRKSGLGRWRSGKGAGCGCCADFELSEGMSYDFEAINYGGSPLAPPESVRLWMQADQLMKEENTKGEV